MHILLFRSEKDFYDFKNWQTILSMRHPPGLPWAEVGNPMHNAPGATGGETAATPSPPSRVTIPVLTLIFGHCLRPQILSSNLLDLRHSTKFAQHDITNCGI